MKKDEVQSKVITVIVPVYNGAKCIERCLRSILSYTEADIECIIVDDGSNDRTPEIVSELAERDFRIKLLRQANSGVSVARNAGLSMASGDWVMFVDADDTLVDEWHRITLEALTVANNSDVILFAHSGPQGDISAHECLLRCTGPDKYMDGCPKSVFICPFSKLFSRSFLEKSDVSFFKDTRIGEDLLFNASVFARNPRVWFCRKPIYQYWKNLDSATNAVDRSFLDNEIAFHRRLNEILLNSDLSAAEAEHIQTYNRLGGILGIITRTPFDSEGIAIMSEVAASEAYAYALNRSELISSSFPSYRRLQLFLLRRGMIRCAFVVQMFLCKARSIIYRRSGEVRIELI